MFALALGLFIRKPSIYVPSLSANIPLKKLFYLTLILSAFYSTYILSNSLTSDNLHGISTTLQNTTGSSLLESRLIFLVVLCFFVEKVLHKIYIKKLSLKSLALYSLPVLIYTISVFMSGTRSLLLEPLGIVFFCFMVRFSTSLSPFKLYFYLSFVFVVFNTISNYFLLNRLGDSRVSTESLLLTFEYGTYLFNMHISYFDSFYSIFDFSYLNSISSIFPSFISNLFDIQSFSSYYYLEEVGRHSSPFYFGGPSQIVELLLNMGPYLAVPAIFVAGFIFDIIGSSYYKQRLGSNSDYSTPLSIFPITFIYVILLLRNPLENFTKSSLYALVISLFLMFLLSSVRIFRKQ